MIEIKYIAVICATVVSMIVGGIWYSKALFGATWMQLIHLDEVRAKKEAMKAMGAMVVLSLFMSYTLAATAYLLHSILEKSILNAGLCAGFWLWLGVAIPILVGQGFFEQRPVKLVLITIGNWFVTLLLMGATIGLIGV